MSMFRKMKERITDEVNSATNKLQSMQLIDNLALTLGQTGRTDHLPSLSYVDNHQQPTSSTFITTNDTISNQSANMIKVNQPFGLLEDNLVDDEELNSSELSSAQLLFNESSIPRNMHSQHKNEFLDRQPTNNGTKAILEKLHVGSVRTDSSLLDISGSLKSDIDSESGDDELVNDINLDGISTEIDLSLETNHSDFNNQSTRYLKLEKYRSKYKNLVHLNRELIAKRDELNRVILDTNNRSLEKTIELKNQIKNLSSQLQALQEIRETKTQNSSQTSPDIDSTKFIGRSTSPHYDKDDKDQVDKVSTKNNAQSEKFNTKIRDLEHLLAKCKESLKAKNIRIEQLLQNLNELDSLKEENTVLKTEIAQLKQQHEDWTVSIAESKRSVHEELETRTSQLNSMKNEYNDLLRKFQESSATLKQQTYKIIDLEGQIVRMNSVHEQEKVDLKKDFEKKERNTLTQLNQEHSRKIANQNQELQNIIDSLKNDIANKDADFLKSCNHITALKDEIESTKLRIKELSYADQKHKEEYVAMSENLERCRDGTCEKMSDLQQKFESKCDELDLMSNEMKAVQTKNQELINNLESINGANSTPSECQACIQVKLDCQKIIEASHQEIFELNSKLTLLSSAIEDQEKEIKQLRLERDSANNENKKLNVEFDELIKKNDSLARVIQDTETDIQNQQEQLDELVNCKHELGALKRTQIDQNKQLEKLNCMLSDKNEQIQALSEKRESIQNDLKDAKLENEKLVKLANSIQNEKEILKSSYDKLSREFSYNNQTMVACILNTMKNLETPGTSPTSEEAICSSDDRSSSMEDLPKSCILMEQLSTLAIERCNAYMIATQRLEASILENKALLAETEHLKEELDRINSERKEYLASSIQETENLREENQILSNEYQLTSENIVQYEKEIALLKAQLNSTQNNVVDEKTNIQLYEERIRKYKEEQALNEAKIKVFIEELDSLKELKCSQEMQLSENSANHTKYAEKIAQLESKYDSLMSNYERKCQSLLQRISDNEMTISKLRNDIPDKKDDPVFSTDKENGLGDMQHKLSELQMDMLDKSEAFDAEKKYYIDTIDSLKVELTTERNRTLSNDHNYQIGALQRVIQQYQEENQRLKELSRTSTQQSSSQMPDVTEYEYLKNIVLQYMLGKEPLVLAKVISAIFRFNPDQIEQVVKTQEILQSTLNLNKVSGPLEKRR